MHLSSIFMDLTALRMRQVRRKAHGSRRRSLPDLTPYALGRGAMGVTYKASTSICDAR